MKLCSACLLGIKCRYDGLSSDNSDVIKLAAEETLIPVCPEQLGGLGTPREVSEIRNGRVISIKGEDVTASFEHGARETLKIAKLYGIREAILKQKSPSCGYGMIYDGTFSGKLIKGNGITAELLSQNGIKIIPNN
jgi:uncharacterized protein YbbK (DUF523 family)